MMDTQAYEVPMRDHVERFWHHLETEYVRILIDLRRETSSAVYWDGSSFPDSVAKALVAERQALITALRAFVVHATYPVSTEINPRGYAWRGEEALDHAKNLADGILDHVSTPQGSGK